MGHNGDDDDDDGSETSQKRVSRYVVYCFPKMIYQAGVFWKCSSCHTPKFHMCVAQIQFYIDYRVKI